MHTSEDVEIKTLPETRVAFMRHVGPYGSPEITALWARFRTWCAAHELRSPPRRMFGIAQDNPNITPRDQTRYDACIEVDATFHPNDELATQVIPSRRYACTPFFGTAAEIQRAWVRLLGHTLPNLGHVPDLCPAIEIYAPGFAVDPTTGAFACTLCMPLRQT